MKYLLLITFSIFSLNLIGQSIDYNLKKGYVAEGYDVVSYFENKAVEGKKEFSLTHDGVKFKFSSKTNLEAFKQNPEQYIPQYGGYCAYAVAVKSKKVGIDPETFEIRDGKLYLFYNSWGNNTLETWRENNVKGLQKKADKNWEAIKDF
ncbi:YHS domain-containing (seleno)protein [Winogradskyella maritima]|uniref:YHS domain-containing (Seleno)protein n=1 Tax=Winogradskyella maritima TaxID=1517766 RepID=A0ABV8AES0_9FLAO|nr:YHS domain-containing (seleno)protein [Winogradskyella maritima]